MKLKKELEEQALLLKHQSSVIGELTHERDVAREEARRHKQMYRDASIAISCVSETVENSTKRRLSDPHHNSRPKSDTKDKAPFDI